MNIVELDFISVVCGYVIGLCLMWSIHTVLFEETLDESAAERSPENNGDSVYHWNYPYNLSASYRRGSPRP